MPKPCVMVSIFTRSASRAPLQEGVYWWAHLSNTEQNELFERIRNVLRSYSSGRFEAHGLSQEELDKAKENAEKHGA